MHKILASKYHKNIKFKHVLCVIISKWKNICENLNKSESHINYLSECLKSDILPMGLNLANLVKSKEIWEGNKANISNLLMGSSKSLLRIQLDRWKMKKLELEGMFDKSYAAAKEAFAKESQAERTQYQSV
jgi:hypothetical protein